MNNIESSNQNQDQLSNWAMYRKARYRYKKLYEKGGEEGLREISKKKQLVWYQKA